MRPWIAVCALIAAAAAAPQSMRTALVCAASIVLEALPYLTASALLATWAGPRARGISAYLGCGCGGGPAARSLPAAVAAAALFGVPVALARLAAATLAARVVRAEDHEHEAALLAGVERLLPAALLGGAIAAFVPASFMTALPPAAALLAGALLGGVASPCALGGIALAASLRAHAPWAAVGVLCTAGMFDLRLPHVPTASSRDRLAYALLAAACGLVAARHGAMLVHPRMSIPLALTALSCTLLALRSGCGRSRAGIASACGLIAAIVIGAPVPSYVATETTLADAFAGEPVTFTGEAATHGAESALVRYAITCCRADAQPVTLMLDRRVEPDVWLRASGTLVEERGALRLHVVRMTRVAPPTDPFVYR